MPELKGKTVKATYTGKGIKAGTVMEYELYLSEGYVPDGSAGFLITCDVLNRAQVKAMETLAKEGICPPFVALGIAPGNLPATTADGFARNMRRDEYDLATRDFPDFVVDELIPAVLKENGVVISDNPDLHLVSGGSSGGIFAWNTAYHRNDFFHRAFISSPSFCAMGAGEDIPFLVRKLEPKPMRLYVTLGEKDLVDYFGSSYPIGLQFRDSLEYAGYDFAFECFLGEGHVCRIFDYYSQLRFMDFIWKEWAVRPITVHGLPPRMKALLAEGSAWRECDAREVFKDRTTLATDKGVYRAENDRLTFTPEGGKTLTLDGFSHISGLALSSDLWRLYVSDTDRRFLYAVSLLPDGKPENVYKLGSLHIDADERKPGAYGLTVSEDDRIFAATDMGIQCMTSFGITDVILPLPNDLRADAVTMVGHTLYARSGKKVFARELTVGANDERVATEPHHTEYFG